MRLADVTRTGRLRLDAVARMLQDVSGDDTGDAAQAPDAAWVVRRIVIELIGRGPRFATTSRSSRGARAPARAGPNAAPISASHGERVRRARSPCGCSPTSRAVVRRASRPGSTRSTERRPAGAASVSGCGTARHPPTRPAALARPGDRHRRVRHVNNAAYWAPVEEMLAEHAAGRRVARAELEFRGGIEPADAAEVVVVPPREGEGDALAGVAGGRARGAGVGGGAARATLGSRAWPRT